MTDQRKRHAPPLAIRAEIEKALYDAFKDEPIRGLSIALVAVETGICAANAKNDAGEAGYV